MRLFPGDDVPDLAAIAQEMPTPWLMPAGLSRRHRDRLGGLVARAVRRFDPRVRCVQVRWVEAPLVREGKIKLPERALIWWRSDTMIEHPADVLREAPHVVRGLHMLDLDRDPGVAAMGWLAPLKLGLLHRLTDALLESGLGGDIEALIDEIDRVADRVVSPIDLLDFTERLVETRAAGMLLEEARLDATALVIAGRLAAGPLRADKAEDWASLLALAARRGPISAEDQARLEARGLTRRDSMALPPMLDWLAMPGVQARVLARFRAEVMPAAAPGAVRAVVVMAAEAAKDEDSAALDAAERAAEGVLEAVRRGEQMRWSRSQAGEEAAKLEEFAKRSDRARHGDFSAALFEREASVLEVAARLLEFARERERAAAALLGAAWRSLTLGELERARTASRRAQELANKTRDRRLQAWASKIVADIAARCDEFEEAGRGYGTALRIWSELADREGEAATYFGMGILAQRKSDLAPAADAFDAALSLYRALGDRLGEANTRRAMGEIALTRDEIEEASRANDAALSLFRAAGNRLSEANTLRSSGKLALRRDDLAEAQQAYDAALSLYRAIGDRRGEANALVGLGELALRRDELAEARQAYDAALLLFRAIGNRLGEGNVLLSIGTLASRRGEPVDAKQACDAALSLYRTIGQRLGEADALRTIGDLAGQRGELAEARRAHETALTLFRAVGNRLGEGNALKSTGDLALRTGDLKAAQQAYDAALSLFRAIDSRLGHANTINSMANLALRTGDMKAAKQAHEAALTLYRAIGDRLGEASALRGVALLALLQGEDGAEALRAAETLGATTQDAQGALLTRTLFAIASPTPAAADDDLDALADGFSSLGLPYETTLTRALARVKAADLAAASAILAERPETAPLASAVAGAAPGAAVKLILPYFAA